MSGIIGQFGARSGVLGMDPVGTVIKCTTTSSTTYTKVETAYNDSGTNYVNVLSSNAFTVKSASSSIYILASLNISFVGGTTFYVRITESTTSLSVILNDYGGRNSQTSSTPCYQYEHAHGQSAGTSLTYTVQLALRASNSNGVRLNDYWTAGQNQSSITTLEVE